MDDEYDIDCTGTEDDMIERETDKALGAGAMSAAAVRGAVGPLVRIILALLAAIGGGSVREALARAKAWTAPVDVEAEVERAANEIREGREALPDRPMTDVIRPLVTDRARLAREVERLTETLVVKSHMAKTLAEDHRKARNALDAARAEIARLTSDLDSLAKDVGQALCAATLRPGETITDQRPHAIVSLVVSLMAEKHAMAAEIARLTAAPGEAWGLLRRIVDAWDDIDLLDSHAQIDRALLDEARAAVEPTVDVTAITHDFRPGAQDGMPQCPDLYVGPSGCNGCGNAPGQRHAWQCEGGAALITPAAAPRVHPDLARRLVGSIASRPTPPRALTEAEARSLAEHIGIKLGLAKDGAEEPVVTATRAILGWYADLGDVPRGAAAGHCPKCGRTKSVIRWTDEHKGTPFYVCSTASPGNGCGHSFTRGDVPPEVRPMPADYAARRDAGEGGHGMATRIREMAVTTGEAERAPDACGHGTLSSWPCDDCERAMAVTTGDEQWTPKPGDRARTADELTAVGYGSGYLRRPGIAGVLTEEHSEGGWWVRHDDGCEAPYDTDELRPVTSGVPSIAGPAGLDAASGPPAEYWDKGVAVEREVVFVDRREGIVITAPKPLPAPAERLCVAVLVEDPNDRVLLVLSGKRHSRHGDRAWELPGGKVHDGEDPREAARREVREEAGLAVVLSTDDPTVLPPSARHRGALLFRGRAEGQPRPGSDAMEARWMSAGEVMRLYRGGRLSDLASRDVLVEWARGAPAADATTHGPEARPRVGAWSAWEPACGASIYDDHGLVVASAWETPDGWRWSANRAHLAPAQGGPVPPDEARRAALDVLETWADVSAARGAQ